MGKGKHHSRKKRITTVIPYLAFTAIVTFIVFLPTLNAGLTNWDDNIYINSNPLIKSFSFKNMQEIFSSFYMGNYHPLTMFSYMIEFSVFGMNPKIFHLTNLVIHILNSLLVFFMVSLISGKNIRMSMFTAFIFAIHPMHVESAAWISERKDVLYCLFFFLSIISYLLYISSKNLKHIIFSFIFFLLSLLSKGQAVVLPVVFLLFDYLYKRNFSVRTLLEKTPFFVLSLIFGIAAYFAQQSVAAVNEVDISMIQSFFSGFYGIVIYIIKFFVPYKLSSFHPYPFIPGIGMPFYFYLMPVIVLLILAIVFISKNRTTVFGFLFFCVNIVLVLQFLPVGKAIFAERYSYVSYFGLSYLTGNYLFGNNRSPFFLRNNSVISTLTVLLLIFFAIISYNRAKVWESSITLWNDVLKKYPDNELAQEHKVVSYLDINNLAVAEKEVQYLLSIAPNKASSYNMYGYILSLQGKFSDAVIAYDKGLFIDSSSYNLHLNKGFSLYKMENYTEALKHYSKAIKIDSSKTELYINRGILYSNNLMRYHEAINDFEKAAILNPDNLNVFVNLGVTCFKLNDYVNSIKNLDYVISVDPKNGSAYLIRSYSNKGKGDFSAALSDAINARNLGEIVDQGYIDELMNK